MHLFFLIFIITINSNVFAQNLDPNTYYDFIILDNNKYFTITSENSIMVYDKNQKKIEYHTSEYDNVYASPLLKLSKSIYVKSFLKEGFYYYLFTIFNLESTTSLIEINIKFEFGFSFKSSIDKNIYCDLIIYIMKQSTLYIYSINNLNHNDNACLKPNYDINYQVKEIVFEQNIDSCLFSEYYKNTYLKFFLSLYKLSNHNICFYQ